MSKKQPEVYKEQLLLALEKNLGLITPSCKDVGITRRSFYNYYNDDPEFRKSVDDIQEIQTDFVENQLFKKIKEGNPQSIIFYLKYRGKKRGYTNSIEVNGGAEPIQIKYILPNDNDNINKGNSGKVE